MESEYAQGAAFPPYGIGQAARGFDNAAKQVPISATAANLEGLANAIFTRLRELDSRMNGGPPSTLGGSQGPAPVPPGDLASTLDRVHQTLVSVDVLSGRILDRL